MPYPHPLKDFEAETLTPGAYLGLACMGQFRDIARALKAGINVLVTADAETVRKSVEEIRDLLEQGGADFSSGRLVELPRATLEGGDNENSLKNTIHQELLRLYFDDRKNGCEAPLVVWHSLELLLSMMNGQLNPALYHEPAYIINDILNRTVWLAFQDPGGPPLPRSLAGVFPMKVRLSGVTTQNLAGLLNRAEARSLSRPGADFFSEEDANQVLDCVKEVNPLYFRRLVRYAVAGGGNREDVLKRLGEAAMRSTRMAAPPKNVDFLGYDNIVGKRGDLRQLVIEPYFNWLKASDPSEKRRIQSYIFKTIILYGEPGTGKTLLARWLASQMGLRYRVVYPSDVKASLLGASEANVRRIFAEARLNAPSMLIFDEMDALFKTRAAGGGAASVETGIASTLLSEMAGFSEDTMVFVVGSTNRREDLDTAFLRPGRGGLQIEVGPPDPVSIAAILGHYIRILGIEDLLEEGKEEFVPAISEFQVYEDDVNREKRIPVSGDHLFGLCRRIFLRNRKVALSAAIDDLKCLARQSLVLEKREGR